MTVGDMHYDLKMKFNKVDSQQYRNLLVPEIDWVLNEAQEVFIKMIAEPRLRMPGLEMNQRTIDDIRTVVKDQFIDGDGIVPSDIDTSRWLVTLPSNYMYFDRAYIKATKVNGATTCTQLIRARVKSHDDMHRESPFDNSNFEWGEINIEFASGGITIFTDTTFTPINMHLSYIIQPPYIANPSAFPGGTYTLPGGTVINVNQDCVLPVQVHRDVVDLAVLILSGEIQTNDYQLKVNKIRLDE